MKGENNSFLRNYYKSKMISRWNEEESFFYENGFYLTSKQTRMSNLLAHYDLYKKIVDLPGDIVELGVFKGASLIQFATYRNILEGEFARKVIGFDMFGEFPQATNEMDKIFREEWVAETNNEYLTIEELRRALKYKGLNNVELIKGDICETLSYYLQNNPFLRVAMLHIDTDIYEPSKVGLEMLYDRVVPGGIIVFDDYGVAGETEAVDELICAKNYTLHKMKNAYFKPVYLQKE